MSFGSFATLFSEAVGDAVRRRIAWVIAGVCLVSLWFVDGCTACAAGEVIVNGEPRELPELAGFTGSAMLIVMSLWVVVLAGVLASDHLAETLDDGSAALTLSRPVSRTSFALARLAGVLALTLATGAILLGGAGFFITSRNELDLLPVLAAAGSCMLGALTIASFAMAASLFVPRLATVMIVLVAVAFVSSANGAGGVSESAGSEPLSGVLGGVHRLGPPLASTVAAALDSWTPQVEIPGDPLALNLRLALWAVLGIATLVVAFRRVELR